MIFVRKLKIAGVMGGYAEQRAGPIIHQHEIRDPHWKPPIRVERMDDLQPGIEAEFFGGFNVGRAGTARSCLRDELGDFGIFRRKGLGNGVPR